MKRRGKIVGYARVSSRSQKDDLERQIEAIKEYCKQQGYSNVLILKDVSSGLNEKRRNFKKLLEMVKNRLVSKVIIAYPDRLTIFGFETLKFFFNAFGVEIIVLNKRELSPQEELVEDLITIISHFAGKLYGMRSHKYKKVVDKAKELITDEKEKGTAEKRSKKERRI